MLRWVTPKNAKRYLPMAALSMYYARGGDSLEGFSAKGTGNAVLIKSGYPYFDAVSPESTLSILQANN